MSTGQRCSGGQGTLRPGDSWPGGPGPEPGSLCLLTCYSVPAHVGDTGTGLFSFCFGRQNQFRGTLQPEAKAGGHCLCM